MSKLKKQGSEMYDTIIQQRMIYGKDMATVAQDVGVSPQTVNRIEKVFKYMRGGEYDKIASAVERNDCGWDYIEWAANCCGIPVPETIWHAKNRRDAKKKEQEKEPAAKPKTEEHNEALYFTKLLEEVTKQNELLLQLLDVVIPKWTQDLKDNINVNADVMCERLKACEEKLEGIKINTKKRGL